MEHYEPSDGWYVTGEESIHPAYTFEVTARDLARFGLLMLRKGKWKDQQIIPADWVEESTCYHSDATLYKSDGYGLQKPNYRFRGIKGLAQKLISFLHE